MKGTYIKLGIYLKPDGRVMEILKYGFGGYLLFETPDLCQSYGEFSIGKNSKLKEYLDQCTYLGKI